jgi:RNA polymerase sigma factor (TIGR02999 family)
MAEGGVADITKLLTAFGNGDRAAFDALLPHVHRELHRLAVHYMAGERAGHVLQATALVNEAYLRLVDSKSVMWNNRAHFFGIASQIMRHVLVDCARAQGREKRGGDRIQVSLTVAEGTSQSADLTGINEALQDLEKLDPRKARIVEMRFFGGLSLEETAAAMNVSVGTVRRDWSLARAWLSRELSKQKDNLRSAH